MSSHATISSFSSFFPPSPFYPFLFVSGKTVLELGGGMTSMAGLAVAACGKPKNVILTDGNPDCVESFQQQYKEKHNNRQKALQQ